MAKNLQTTCDSCNEVLWGHDKAAFKEKPFVEIKGSIVLQNVKRGIENHHIFITRKDEKDLTFCDWGCVEDWVESRKSQFLTRFETTLREEVMNEPWNQ